MHRRSDAEGAGPPAADSYPDRKRRYSRLRLNLAWKSREPQNHVCAPRLEENLVGLRGCHYRAGDQSSISMISTETRPSPWKSGLASGSRGFSLLRTSAPSTTSPKIV